MTDRASLATYAAVLTLVTAVGIGGCAQSLDAVPTSRGNQAGIFDWLDTPAKSEGPNRPGSAQSSKEQAEIYYGSGAAQPQRNAQSGAPQLAEGRITPASLVLRDERLGSGSLAQQGGSGRPPLSGEGITRTNRDTINLNFENADLRSVVRAVLGDLLNLNYTIDPQISGTVSLSTRRPVRREQVFPLLENALRAQGVVIVQEGGTFRILDDKDAAGMGGANVGRDTGDDGLGVTALPLENISAEAVLKILDGFGARPGSVRVDADRNLLIVRGTATERQTLIDNALAFDVEWMRNQSVGIFPIHNANPETVIAELEKMADPSLLRFQPIARMNAVLAISKSPQSIRQVSTWVARLDRINDIGIRVRVYRLRNADARRVAALVRDVFGGGGGAGMGAGFPGVADQITPGSSSVTTRVAAAGPVAANTRTTATTETRTDANAPVAPIDPMGDPGFGGSNSKIRITADPANNAVVVYASQQDSKMIERAIRDLDRAPVQVAIEATVAEIELNDALRNGVQVFLTSKDVKLGNDKGSFSMLNDILPLARVIPGLNLVLGKEAGPKLILDVLREVTDVKVLSSPSLMVVDSQPAILQVGDQVPITTRTAQDVTNPTAPIVNSIDFRDTGVILRVTPRVRGNSTVAIEVEQEISAVKETTTANGGAGGASTLTPTISQRKVRSTVSVTDGQTLLLGGLISEQRSGGKKGLPGVMDLPVLGNIFTNHTDSNKRTELIIFIKPQIVRGTFDGKRVAEDLRRRMKGFERW